MAGYNMLDFLRAEMLQARLRKDTEWVKVISTAIGALENKVNKDFVTSDQLVLWAKSQMKAINETVAEAAFQGVEYTPDALWVKFLQEHIPSQMSEDEIYDFFTTKCAHATQLGELMAAIKSAHPGKYDGKLASSIARSVLTTITK